MPVQKLNRAIMYRAYPTPEQQVLLYKTFGCVRFVWNHMLMDAQRFLEEAGAFFIPTPAKYKTEFSLYYRVVVIRAPLQGLCYTVRDAVDWLGSPTTRWFQKGSNHSPLQFC